MYICMSSIVDSVENMIGGLLGQQNFTSLNISGDTVTIEVKQVYT